MANPRRVSPNGRRLVHRPVVGGLRHPSDHEHDPSSGQDNSIIATAAKLWQHWIDAGIVRVGDYDRDLVDLITQEIRRVGGGAPGAASLG